MPHRVVLALAAVPVVLVALTACGTDVDVPAAPSGVGSVPTPAGSPATSSPTERASAAGDLSTAADIDPCALLSDAARAEAGLAPGREAPAGSAFRTCVFDAADRGGAGMSVATWYSTSLDTRRTTYDAPVAATVAGFEGFTSSTPADGVVSCAVVLGTSPAGTLDVTATIAGATGTDACAVLLPVAEAAVEGLRAAQ